MRTLSQQLELLLGAAAKSDDRVVVEQAQRLLRLKQENPLAFFDPYPKQVGYLSSRHPVKAFFGGNGAGKTLVGTADDLIQCVDRDVLPDHLLPFKRWDPPVYGRIVVPKADQIETVALEKVRELCPRNQLPKGGVDAAYSKVNRRLLFRNGSSILFNTSEQDRDAHAGVELHWVRFDEEPPGDHGRGLYTENIARLRRYAPDAQIRFTMTPLFGLSWTYDEVWERREEPQVFVTVASMRDNPHIDSEAVIRSLSHLSEEEKRAVVEGQFVHLHGRVLERFDFEQHVIPFSVAEPDDRKFVRGLDVHVGIDPGIKRAGVVWVGFDRDNRMFVFDEHYPEGDPDATVPRMAEAIRAKNRAWGLDANRVIYVIDPSSRIRGLANAETVIGEFNREGIYPNPGQNDRLAGVLQLRARVDHKALHVSKSCVNWLMEVRRWLVAADEDTEKEKNKTKGAGGSFATKGPDHLMDPTRYVAMERLWYEAPVPQKRGYGDMWVPGTAPPAGWLQSRGPRDYHPMGSMS